MGDTMAETMVAEFKRLPQRAYLGGYTSRFGSRTHFQLATFSALMRTPELLLLSMTLRYLAGGSYLHVYQMHGVSRTAFYDTMLLVCFAIVEAFPLSFPVDDSAALVCGLIA